MYVQEYKRCLYYDGHEQADVVIYQEKFINEMLDICKREHSYIGEMMDQQVYADLKDGTRDIICIYHDESKIHTNEQPRLVWMTDKDCALRTKSVGKLIHISDFICLSTG